MRKKTPLTLILNESARKVTFKKRKTGLKKKLNELCILCGIDACCIIHSPYDNEPEVWPSREGVQKVLTKFSEMPESKQFNKMLNQDSFTKQRVTKAKILLKKMQEENREIEMNHIITNCLGGEVYSISDIVDPTVMGIVLNKKLKEIEMRLEALKNEQHGGNGNGFFVGECSNTNHNGYEIPTSEPKKAVTNGKEIIGWEEALLFAQGPSNP